MVAEDCFVYHSSGKTFAEMGRDRVKTLMHENKRVLRKKYHGKIKLFHMRDRNMNIMKQYLLVKRECTVNLYDLDYKFNNRLLLANTMYPHNPVKKLIYYLRLRCLCSDFRQESYSTPMMRY